MTELKNKNNQSLQQAEQSIDPTGKVAWNGSPLPVKTWNWLKVNDSRISLPEQLAQTAQNHYEDDVAASCECTAEGIDEALIKAAHGAIGTEYEAWIERNQKRPKLIVINPKDKEQVYRFQHELTDKQEMAEHVLVYAKAGSKAQLIFETSSLKENSGIYTLLLQCYLEEGAELKLYQTQMLGEGCQYISDIGVTQEKDSKLQVVRASLGGKNTYLGMKTDLIGDGATADSSLAYLGRGDQKIDINDVVLHKGKKTNCELDSQGVLSGQTEKTYKGTIDLQHGCVGAKGQELETVLLLNDDVVNKTVPLILCGEEDVEGNHGASIGKIDEESLLYMESRGISEEQAKLMIVNGRLNQMIQKIPDAGLVDRAGTFVKEVLEDERERA